MKHALTIIAAALLVAAGLGASLALAAETDHPATPPGQGECEHGNSTQPCVPDPQPGHGQDCDEHGPAAGGVNEDHCTPTETTPTDTHPTTPTDTHPTPPSETHPAPPSGPRCPPGMTPTAGKDGHPGNDECEFPPSNSTTTTTTPAPPVTNTVTVTQTVTVPGPPQPPKVITITKTKTKLKTKVVRKIVVRKIVVHKACPPNTRLWKGKCHPIVPGKG